MFADEIRTTPAQRFHAASIAAIEAKSFAEPHSAETINAMLMCRHHVVSVAKVGGGVVGYLAARIERDRFEIERLAVSPTLRRRGIGWTLVTLLKAKAHNPYGDRPRRRVGVSLPEDSVTLEQCRFFAALGFHAHAVGDVWRFVYRPEPRIAAVEPVRPVYMQGRV